MPSLVAHFYNLVFRGNPHSDAEQEHGYERIESEAIITRQSVPKEC